MSLGQNPYFSGSGSKAPEAVVAAVSAPGATR